jgi:hypothetical protein
MIITEIPRFGRGNAKLPTSTLTFSLPSGFTCPGALQCQAWAGRTTGKLRDGDHQLFRCYEASIESRYRSVREHRWRNFELLRHLDATDMAHVLQAGIAAARQPKSTHVRWFAGGDFFSPALRDAIIACASATPELIHYAYTKSVPFFLTGQQWMELPVNLRITMSWGGNFDHLIAHYRYPRTARVLHTRAEASTAGLPIDTTDRLAWQDEPVHFCHLSHGSQAAGSEASRALAARRRAGDFTGYSAKRPAIQPLEPVHA